MAPKKEKKPERATTSPKSTTPPKSTARPKSAVPDKPEKAARSKKAAKPEASSETTQEAEQPLVLVVDDYHDAREMYTEYLRFSGFRVAEATNGLEALEQAFKLLPNIILMDLSLPVLDGWEATRRLKADSRTQKIPVVALTGHALAGHAEGAKEAGCDAFITKPCLPDALVREVNKMLESARKGTTRTRSLRG